ncbi:hypothetical protein KIW84_023683 [Lathyrus oleraceus]|uniref:Tf2-1-like SH3-like domain-containing protein n=1 Tax=Pisum sativum TaxID=3888 RepID=A0A9D4YJH8_PEA|nr:hypothetical protein KIW84_023683 [Pisum sativum]
MTVYELPNDLPLQRDKPQKVKAFNTGEGVIVFLHKERFPVGTYNKLQPHKYDPFKLTQKCNDTAYVVVLPNFMNIFNTFNVAGIHEYQANETLYQEEKSGLSSLEVDGTDLGSSRQPSRILQENNQESTDEENNQELLQRKMGNGELKVNPLFARGKCIKKKKLISIRVVGRKITKSEEEDKKVNDPEVKKSDEKKLVDIYVDDP